jgi:hypothetical protein
MVLPTTFDVIEQSESRSRAMDAIDNYEVFKNISNKP